MKQRASLFKILTWGIIFVTGIVFGLFIEIFNTNSTGEIWMLHLFIRFCCYILFFERINSDFDTRKKNTGDTIGDYKLTDKYSDSLELRHIFFGLTSSHKTWPARRQYVRYSDILVSFSA